MNVTIIGLGSIGKRHLKTLETFKNDLLISKISVFDLNKDRYKEIKDFDVILSENLESALESTDTVFLCVPTSLHIPVYDEITKYGNFDFFIEKPFSHTLAGCEKIINQQKNHNKKIVIGYMLRFHPVLLKVKKYLENDLIGDVLSVRAESGFYLPFWHPWEDYRDFYMSSKIGGGGVLLDTSHEIDYLCWLFGNVSNVNGIFDKISDLDISSDDFATFNMKFKNNIFAEVHLDLLQPDESRYLKIIGKKGVLIGDLKNQKIKFNLIDKVEWQEESVEVDFDKIYENEMRAFFAYIHKGKKEVFSENDALHVMEIIEAVRRSSSYGIRISLPLYD